MRDRKTVPEMIGEFFREAGSLLVIGYGVVSLLSRGQQFYIGGAILGLSIGLSLWTVGVLVERERRR